MEEHGENGRESVMRMLFGEPYEVASSNGRAELGEGGCVRLLAALREMETPLAHRRHGVGDAVYREGEELGALYVLAKGVVRLRTGYTAHVGSKDATVLLLGPGEVFGYPLFREGRFRRTSAEAVTDCEFVKIPRVFVERAVRRRPEVAFDVAALLEVRLGEYEELVGCLLPRRTEARLARLLPILARKFGEPEGGRTAIGLKLTRSDLAAMTASTRESVTAAVLRLSRRGILAMDAGRVVILDPGRLANVGRR